MRLGAKLPAVRPIRGRGLHRHGQDLPGLRPCQAGLQEAAGSPCARMPDLFVDREERLSAGVSEQKLLRKYARHDVLVVDEWLIDPLAPDQMRFMFELVDRRSDSASTIWRSQYPVSDWHERLGGGTHADAILDRIVHNATTVETGEVNMRELTACGTRS